MLDKIREEMEELRQGVAGRDKSAVEAELGDLLFSIVNFARFVDVDPEQALRGTIHKFIRRFRRVVLELKVRGKTPDDATLEEIDAIWDTAMASEE